MKTYLAVLTIFPKQEATQQTSVRHISKLYRKPKSIAQIGALLVLLISGFLPQLIQAQVTTPHPRLILDAATLTTLRARAAANTPQWQTLKTFCDSLIGGTVNLPNGSAYPNKPNVGSGYQGEDYFPALLAEGLCYQVLKSTNPSAAAPYGAKARAILLAMSTPSGSGGASPCTDVGFGIRFYGAGMGIGYDWVYDLLSTSDKQQVYTTANAWIASFANVSGCSGFEYKHPQSNYFAGFFHAYAAIALATYGENPNAPTLWNDWQNKEFKTATSSPPHTGVQPYYASRLAGGGWPEGFGNYAPLAIFHMSMPVREVMTATGVDLVNNSAAPYTYPLDSANYLMHFTWPSRDYIDDRDTNRASGNANPPVGTANMSMFAHVLATLRYWNSPQADVFQQYANEVNQATSGYAAGQAWEKFLFWDPNGTTQPVDSLPLSYLAPGMGAVAARSDWTKNATWMSFRSGPYTNNPDQGEEGFDQGSLALVRGKVPLLINASGQVVQEPNGAADDDRLYTDLYGNFDANKNIYVSNRQLYNVFYVRNMTGSTPTNSYGQNSSTTAATSVSRFEDRDDYVYLLSTRLEDMYKSFAGVKAVTTWSRQIVYLRPNRVVVYDRTTKGNASYDQYLAFHFPTSPVSVSAPSGETRMDVTYKSTYAGAMTVVLPTNATTTTIGLYPASNPAKAWQVQIRPTNNNVSQTWLTVFDMSTPSSAAAISSPVTVTAGTLLGVYLSASDGNNVVLSSTGTAGTPLSLSVPAQYSVPSAAAHHLITEVVANTGYSISVINSGGAHSITVTAGGPFTSSPKGVLHFSVSANGAVTQNDTIFSNGFGD